MTSDLISKIIAQGDRLATHSWEYGTFSEALLEWYDPSYSVFGNETFPAGRIPVLQVDQVRSLEYAKPHIWTNMTTLIDGDGAAGDPASLGVSAILIGQTQPAYEAAADRQMTHLLTAVPRWPNGAISHREAVAELWADFLYMGPPALAYWAVQRDDAGLLDEVLRQCGLYRDVLGVPEGSGNASGLWHHIIGPETQDLGVWSTGNAWAAAGMSRVLATAKKAPFAETVKGLGGLKGIIGGILDAAIALDRAEPEEPLLRNYLNDTSWFGELSGTTLLTATAYRMALLEPEEFGGEEAGYVAWADEKRAEIIERIDDEGLLSPVINPLEWGDRQPGTESPEAQSFAVLMYAAHRDYQESCSSHSEA
ncbi:Uu.00g021670.m01.CDS01 [Anthostomella pinea]|uniref:Uu.00g021670.m01.CDS01 n=1 Tax=Anthostomella pinea TaxID=933095 RepID=A0AAI8VZQ9_9PEZI|nr:Uu.00g021670.m01.CDS01 [Anthostomella pinea]